MQFRHYALAFVVFAIAIPLLAMLSFLVPSLLPLILIVPVLIVACWRAMAKLNVPTATSR